MDEFVEDLNSKFDDSRAELHTSLHCLKLEKNLIKKELGNMQEVGIPGEFNAATVWQSVSLIAEYLKHKSLEGLDERGKSRKDLFAAPSIEGASNLMPRFLKQETELKATKNDACRLAEKVKALEADSSAFSDTKRKLLNMKRTVVALSSQEVVHHRLDSRVSTLEKIARPWSSSDANDSADLEGRFSNLEGQIVDMLVKTSLVDYLGREIKEIKSNKDSDFVKFDNLTIHSLQDITNYLSEHIFSMNYSLMTDLHVLLEYIYYNIKASKPTLEFLESTYTKSCHSHTII